MTETTLFRQETAASPDPKTPFIDLRWASTFALRLLRRDKSERPALL